MSKKDYELLGLDESASDDAIRARYEELKNKYSEERFMEGEAGNEAARMLNRLDAAYNAIMSERAESTQGQASGASFSKAEELIRAGKLNEAQAVLDSFNERSAEWHYLQSVIFYKKNWINESKKQLEIAVEMDSSNEKYSTAYKKLKEKIEFDSSSANDIPNGSYVDYGDGNRTGGTGAGGQQPQQMGGGFCESCATCCACNMLFNCLLNSCCGCH